MRRRLRTLLGLAATVAVAVTGCTTHQRAAPGLGAAEPAVAPAAGPTPAGTVVTVGAEAEGVVYDPSTQLVAVAVRKPNRLLLLDAQTLAVRRAVPLPGTVRHLQLAQPGGPVLVPCESADVLAEVPLPAGETQTTPVGKSPHDASLTSDGRVVVGNEFGASLSIVRAGVVERTVSGVSQPGGVTGDGPDAVVVDVGAFTISTWDAATGQRSAVLPAGAGPTHLGIVGPHRVIVADTRGGAALVFATDPLRPIGRAPLPGAPYGLATDPSTGLAWLTLTARNEVVGLDVSTSSPREVARYPTVPQPNTVTVAPGSHTLWVAGARTGQVEKDRAVIRLATLNLMGGRSARGDLLDPGTLRDVIARLDPDVLAVQEVDRGQPRSGGRDLTAELASAMSARDARFAPTLVGTPGGQWRPSEDTDDATEPAYGIALLSRFPATSWSVTRFRTARLWAPLVVPTERGPRVLPVKDEPRVLLAAHVDGPTGPFTVGVTHLSFIPGWNVWQLRRGLAALDGRPAPRYLLGDLNIPGRVVDRVTSWRRLANAPTWPSREPRVQFDHVLADRPPVGRVDARAEALDVSDHRAVVVDVH